MKTTSLKTAFSFLHGGGEMGELTRNYNWNATSLGSPQQWPQSLRTTLSILLNSKFPMFLFWGHGLICFYNDAYRPSLGNEGKHPWALGKPGEEVWPEIWPVIKPLIDQVLGGSDATWSEDQLIPIYRNGKMEDVYWTFSYSPVNDESGRPAGVFVTCTETTKTVEALTALTDSKDQLQFAIEATELGLWDLNPLTNKFTANKRLKKWFGLQPDDEIELSIAVNAIAEGDRDRVSAAIQKAMDYSSGGGYDIEYTIVHLVTKAERVVRAKGRAWFGEDKIAYRFNGTLQDITEQAIAREKIKVSESRFRSLIEEATIASCLFTGRDMVIALANKTILGYWGKGDDVIGKPLREAIPELEGQPFLQILDDVFTTGKTYKASDAKADLVVGGKPGAYYFDFTYKALRDGAGKISGVMNTAVDVTDKVLARKNLEDKEANLRNIILQAPVAMCIFRGPAFVIEIANEKMFEFWGSSADAVMNRPLFEALPSAKGQGFEELLKNVYTAGEPFSASESPVALPRNGKIETVFINFSYEPVREADNRISGIIATATDITIQVVARQAIEVAEKRARLSIEAAELGTYEINLLTNQALTSSRFNAIFETDGSPEHKHYVNSIYKEDLPVREAAYRTAMETGVLDYEARIRRGNGAMRWIRAMGHVLFDDEKKPVKLLGVIQDITKQKEFAEELTKQVSERTVELENKNRELERSNSHLEEFAHAASHDLKEPIRKIHFFTERLKTQLSDKLSSEDERMFERVEHASQRMNALIDDLLLYSHVSQRPQEKEVVDLNEKLESVLEDLELDIGDKEAVITVDKLPLVKGYRRQLQQLFQNLLTNALKYSRSGVAPQIKITSSIISGAEAGLPADTEYHLLMVSDNGIGFEPEHAEKIFQMFQRLHGKSEYSGTGVGLSIVRKIVENHGGKIVAQGEPGKGATFRIYLPLV